MAGRPIQYDAKSNIDKARHLIGACIGKLNPLLAKGISIRLEIIYDEHAPPIISERKASVCRQDSTLEISLDTINGGGSYKLGRNIHGHFVFSSPEDLAASSASLASQLAAPAPPLAARVFMESLPSISEPEKLKTETHSPPIQTANDANETAPAAKSPDFVDGVPLPDFNSQGWKAMPFGDRADKFFIEHGYYGVCPGAYALPEVIGREGFEKWAGKTKDKTRNGWAREILEGIIHGTLDGWEGRQDGWRYLLESKAIRIHQHGYFKSKEVCRRWVADLVSYRGGPDKVRLKEDMYLHLTGLLSHSCKWKKGAVRKGLSPAMIAITEFFPIDADAQGRFKRFSNWENQHAAALSLNEKLRKRDGLTPLEAKVLAKHMAGGRLPERELRFCAGSESANHLFGGSATIPMPASAIEFNIELKRIAGQFDVKNAFTLGQDSFIYLNKAGARTELRWCSITNKGEFLQFEKKPLHELSIPGVQSAPVNGSNGITYLAVKEGGGINIYYDEKTILDGIYKHPSDWTSADFGSGRYTRILRTYYDSIYDFARSHFPEKMAQVKEWQMAGVQHFFFTNTPLHLDGAPARRGHGIASWIGSLLPKSEDEVKLLPAGGKTYAQAKDGGMFIVERGADGKLAIQTDRRMNVIEAILWAESHFGTPISTPIIKEAGLTRLLNFLPVSSFRMLAHPESEFMALNGMRRQMDESGALACLRRLYPDIEDWLAWRKSPQGEDAWKYFMDARGKPPQAIHAPTRAHRMLTGQARGSNARTPLHAPASTDEKKRGQRKKKATNSEGTVAWGPQTPMPKSASEYDWARACLLHHKGLLMQFAQHAVVEVTVKFGRTAVSWQSASGNSLPPGAPKVSVRISLDEGGRNHFELGGKNYEIRLKRFSATLEKIHSLIDG